jgi:hypothetical protein
VEEIRKFLGLVIFSPRFIPKFAMLTRIGVSFIWVCEQEEVFVTHKDSLTSTPVLSYDKRYPSTVIVDSNPVGLGAILVHLS